MNQSYLSDQFNLSGKSAVITGGGGVLCGAISQWLARLEIKISVLDTNLVAAKKIVESIGLAGGEALAVQCNVLDKSSILTAADTIISKFGKVDILINGAGGNNVQATTTPDQTFFELPSNAIESVINLNLMGTLLPSQVFGKHIATQGQGVILNISSMNAFRPLTHIPAYSAAKAAVSNFTQWLAVHLAQEVSPNIRVNAIAPGFFITEQNRFLLYEKDTSILTPRGDNILKHTPMGRFGEPQDLLGTILWLLSPASAFVTGVVIPIDGGFSAFSGV